MPGPMDMPENVATSIQAWEIGGLTTCFAVPWPAPERGSAAAAAETATTAIARVIVYDMATPLCSGSLPPCTGNSHGHSCSAGDDLAYESLGPDSSGLMSERGSAGSRARRRPELGTPRPYTCRFWASESGSVPVLTARGASCTT